MEIIGSSATRTCEEKRVMGLDKPNGNHIGVQGLCVLALVHIKAYWHGDENFESGKCTGPYLLVGIAPVFMYI